MNPLLDLIPAQYRRYLYALASVALVIYTAVEAAGGDWRQAVGALVAAAVTSLAHANTTADTED